MYKQFYVKYTITQILGNAAAHVHYHPCSEYQAVFLPSALLEEKRPGDEASIGVCQQKCSREQKMFTKLATYFTTRMYVCIAICKQKCSREQKMFTKVIILFKDGMATEMFT